MHCLSLINFNLNKKALFKLITKFFLLISIYDKPAKATMLNMKGSTGYFGCTQCEIEGESVQFQNGNHLIFKPTDPIRVTNRSLYLVA